MAKQVRDLGAKLDGLRLQTRVCQFCRLYGRTWHERREVFKYGVRHYAHPWCLVYAKVGQGKEGERAALLVAEHERADFWAKFEARKKRVAELVLGASLMSDLLPYEDILRTLMQMPDYRLGYLRSDVSRHAYIYPWEPEAPLRISYATATSHKRRGLVLKVLYELSLELARQLEEEGRCEGEKNPFEKVLPDTVLHEQGIRHDPMLCQHCGDGAIRFR